MLLVEIVREAVMQVVRVQIEIENRDKSFLYALFGEFDLYENLCKE